MPPVIHLLGVPIHNCTSREAVGEIFDSLGRGQGGWVFTPNLEILRLLVRDHEYAGVTSAATLRLADGMPLIWASRLQGTPLPERIAGSEIIWPLCERAAREGRSVFLLGGNEGVAARCAAILADRCPGLRVAGVECPPVGFESDEPYLAGLESRLRAAGPDLCFVGLPSLKQDKLIRRLLPVLPHAWFAGIGITFSFITGGVRKPPVIVRRLGLEWFFRFLQEPRRLARRYFIDGVPFAIRLLSTAARDRFRQRPAAPRAEINADPAHPPTR